MEWPIYVEGERGVGTQEQWEWEARLREVAGERAGDGICPRAREPGDIFRNRSTQRRESLRKAAESGSISYRKREIQTPLSPVVYE